MQHPPLLLAVRPWHWRWSPSHLPCSLPIPLPTTATTARGWWFATWCLTSYGHVKMQHQLLVNNDLKQMLWQPKAPSLTSRLGHEFNLRGQFAGGKHFFTHLPGHTLRLTPCQRQARRDGEVESGQSICFDPPSLLTDFAQTTCWVSHERAVARKFKEEIIPVHNKVETTVPWAPTPTVLYRVQPLLHRPQAV